jgi:hypothetical protein
MIPAVRIAAIIRAPACRASRDGAACRCRARPAAPSRTRLARRVVTTYFSPTIIKSMREASVMSAQFIRGHALAILGVAAVLSLSACGTNEYGPPPSDGKPQNWGQQHYLDNQRYQQMNEDRMP